MVLETMDRRRGVRSVVLKPGDRGVVESESTEPPQRTRAFDGVVHEELAPRNRIRRDDGRKSIDTPAAGALCKAGTRWTA
jgi:hypothetical protein